MGEQDVAKAKAWLDERAQAEGWNKANKLEGRNTKQGLVGLQTTKCATAAAMVELNSETDFVARNKVFHVLLNSIVEVFWQRHNQSPPVALICPLRRWARKLLERLLPQMARPWLTWWPSTLARLGRTSFSGGPSC